MANPRPEDILLRVGGRCLTRHGVLAMAGPARGGVEIPYTHTRADASTCARLFDRDGLSQLAVANGLRLQWEDLNSDGVRDTPGILLESTRTNVVLHNRDMTNAAWTKTNCTAAKTQTGIDGVTNSASSLTATAGNATCLQAIVLASSQRYQSAYVKRITGSGNIDMTMDNGATWTTVTLTTSWTPVVILTQTLANPTVGFRIVTSGDAIAVDMVQNENGAFRTSPIATTTGAVTRAADNLTVPFNFGPMDVTILTRTARPTYADLSGTIGTRNIVSISTAAARLQPIYSSGARQLIANIDTPTTDTNPVQGIPAGTEISAAFQYRALTTGGMARVDSGAGFIAEGGPATAFSAFGNQTLGVGVAAAGTEVCAPVTDLIVFRGLFTRAECLTVP